MNTLKCQQKLTKYQSRVIGIIVTRIESSKTYLGTNKVNRSFVCRPDEVIEDYYSDYADFDDVEHFNLEIKELERSGLIIIKENRNEIQKIIGKQELYSKYCAMLVRKERKKEADEYREVLNMYANKTVTLGRYSLKMREYLDDNKKIPNIFSIDELEQTLRCIRFIETNTDEILERELSIELFSDSKMFEKCYRSKVCTIMKNFGDYSELIDGESETKTIYNLILSSNNVVPNPTYIYFKGNGKIIYTDGKIVPLYVDHSLAINSNDLNSISRIDLGMRFVMTIENLTSFNRMNSDDVFLIYLSGYNNTAKSIFLKLLSKDNMIEKWFHFGDLDPDGFYILENLKKTTGLDILPYKMDVNEFEKFRDYAKPLDEHDVVKAKSLLDMGKYIEALNYMVKNQCKLEQEIISWKESRISFSSGTDS